jgi:hypothetical protein
MCQRIAHRHPICCILPPHIIDAVVQRGTPSQRARAMRTLATDNTLRALRASPSPAAPSRGVGRPTSVNTPSA